MGGPPPLMVVVLVDVEVEVEADVEVEVEADVEVEVDEDVLVVVVEVPSWVISNVFPAAMMVPSRWLGEGFASTRKST